jgi:MoaA/NifB/PqqE/SkfB family radical SAM enzyme
MSDLPRPFANTAAQVPTLRLSEDVNEELIKGQRSQVPPPRNGIPATLPDPVFPRNPKLFTASDEDYFPKDGKRHYTLPQIYHSMRGWMFPYFRSRLLPGEFHPLITYLFTEWKCNLDCHYCWAFDNRVTGMTEDVARRSIDWLYSTTCRVLALMGGEVLLRPKFAHKVIDYATQKGFWVYLPTNGRLLKPDTIDRIADAGVGSVNLAVDAWDLKPGLPKAMVPIRENFNHLIRRQYKYGYTVFLNINICRNNLEDVRMLTELAHDNNIATDYHICETPMMEHSEFRHFNDNPVFIRPEDHAAIGELVDWLIEKQQSGWHMVNSVQRLAEMKKFINKELEEWGCRAGQNSMIIRTDGTLAPCFPMYSSNHDWGTIEAPRMDAKQLCAMKKECEPNCFSTLNHILAFCYNDANVLRWLLRQAAHGFQGVTGNME